MPMKQSFRNAMRPRIALMTITWLVTTLKSAMDVLLGYSRARSGIPPPDVRGHIKPCVEDEGGPFPLNYNLIWRTESPRTKLTTGLGSRSEAIGFCHFRPSITINKMCDITISGCLSYCTCQMFHTCISHVQKQWPHSLDLRSYQTSTCFQDTL